jgi:hypothetical protein
MCHRGKGLHGYCDSRNYYRLALSPLYVNMLYEDKLPCFVLFSQILANEVGALRPAPHLKESKYQITTHLIQQVTYQVC